MSKRNSSNQSNSNFRQQKGTARKLEKDLHTVEQQQVNRTASVLKDQAADQRSSGSKGKLKKQYTDQASEEFRQQESTASKIEQTFTTGEQQQLNQAVGVLERPESTASDQSAGSKKYKLKKQYTNQAAEELRQQESTASKIERPVTTSEQQQLNRTTSVLGSTASDQSAGSKKYKLKKQYANQAAEKFRKQEGTAGKLERTFTTSEQQQINQTASVLNRPASDQSASSKKGKLKNQYSKQAAEELQKSKSGIKKRKFVLQKAGTLGKGTLIATGNTLKSGATKYQRALEKDDEGVKIASQGITVTGKLSKKAARKLKEKKLSRKNFIKASQNPLSKEKKKENSLRKISKTPALVLKKGTLKYQEELEKGDEGVKLASQGATATAKAAKKLTKGTKKVAAKPGKLDKQSSKLLQSQFNKQKKLRVESKAALKKKAMKKKLYAPTRNKNKAFTGVMSSFSNRIRTIFKSFGKFDFKNVKNLITAKLATYFGGGLVAVLPLLLVALICLVIAGILGAGGSKQIQEIEMGGGMGISQDVRKWCPLIEQEAKAQGMEAYVNLLAAIIQVETGGKGTRDIMQSSESAGFPRNHWQTEEESIRQGVKHLKGIVGILQGFNSGYEANTKLLAQAYNFGSAFAGYVGRQGGIYTLDVAEKYSREVVAPSLGNFTGETYSYVNPTSTKLGKPYLYRNGGNFMYGELVGQYGGCSVGGAGITGDFAAVLQELEKFQGWPYVWGGKNPSTGFDCSGLTSWGLAQIGIKLPSYAASQYDLTVPIDPSEAQPGDLIFFKGTYGGPNHISHVGFYIDENTMYDSNGSGVGYHNWKDPYWQKHFAGIRRVVSK